jgi:hypothetical protein
MNRHQDWCTIVCLIGVGQEINTGEAGLKNGLNHLMINSMIGIFIIHQDY